ncbi:MAG: glutamate mutase L, partial [Proteobacteria bacterium]|nr:glutamate mutase L [Pseudomonadota bacterium]
MTLELVALADFGSTFTKLTLVEAGSGRRVASAASPTTVESDVMEGYGRALEMALGAVGRPARVIDKLAPSSAGGG